MGLRLSRFLGAIESLSPGQFVTDTTTLITWICCPICGRIVTLGGHVVSRSGQVTPAWKCPDETCAFFDWIELDSWGQAIW